MLRFLGKQDVYIEIAEKYKQHILNQIYKNGEKLPSVRVVATELGVNPNTVAKAYSLLESEGYIRALPKKGAYVIYDEVASSNAENEKSSAVKSVLCEFKNKGIEYDAMIALVKEVYGIDD